MSALAFNSTADPAKLAELFTLCGSEWGAPLSPQEFGKVETEALLEQLSDGKRARGYYLESEDGQVVASCIVTHNHALYKEQPTDNINGVPDGVFGVRNITALRLSFVFVSKAHRGKGLMTTVVKKTIDSVEAEISRHELAALEEQVGPAQSVSGDNGTDYTLANHHLAKWYFWYLYSAVGTAYSKFGFRAYPMEGYRLACRPTNEEVFGWVDKMLEGSGQVRGRRLQLLGNSPEDVETIRQIYQQRQLLVVSEMNRSSPSDCSGKRRSSSSALSEELSPTEPARSGAHSLPRGPSKVAVLPDREYVDAHYKLGHAISEKVVTSENRKYAGTRGAILTNDAKRKTFYVLWSQIMSGDFFIVGMGELGGGDSGSGSGRASGANQLDGPNFQDWELLVNTAIYVAQKKWRTYEGSRVNVCVNDLPQDIPSPTMHGFFCNYLGPQEEPPQFVPDFAPSQVLPMIKQFGSEWDNFELDWVDNSISNWG